MSHTDEYSKNMQLLKLDDLYKFNLTTHIFKVLVINPNYRHFPKNSNINIYQTRNRNNLYNIRCNRSKTQSSFVYQSAIVWNSLPEDSNIYILNIKDSDMI